MLTKLTLQEYIHTTMSPMARTMKKDVLHSSSRTFAYHMQSPRFNPSQTKRKGKKLKGRDGEERTINNIKFKENEKGHR